MSTDKQSVWRRYRDVLRRHASDDVADEIQFHLDMRIDEARRAGLTDDLARAAAHRRFGEPHAVEAELLALNGKRDRRGARVEWMSDLKQDVAFALRSLRRAPAFAAAAIATLAIAIGANTAIYSVVHALLLAKLPFANSEQLAVPVSWGWQAGELLALREQLKSADDVAAFGGFSANIDDGSRADRLDGATVTANFFSLLGRAPLLGTTFATDASDPGHNAVIVISEGLWRTRFGGDSTIVGRQLLFDGTTVLVAGVMPSDFNFPSSTTTFWKPYVIDPRNPVSLWASGGHRPIIRLHRGVSVDAARREFLSLVPTLRHANTMWDPGPNYGRGADLSGFHDAIVGETRPALFLLLGCAGLVLLIACANVANLLLARASVRDREIAVRAALGGGRGRLIRQLLTESVVVAIVGGVLGLLLAFAGVRWIVGALPPSVPRASEISVNAAALVFTAAISIVTGILFGVLPAIRATRAQSGPDAVRSARAGRGVGHQRISAALVVAEVALAVVLGVGAELLTRGFADLRQLNPGFTTSHIVTARITPPIASYAAGTRADVFYSTVLTRLEAMPGVRSVGGVSSLPLASPVWGMGTRIEGQAENVKQGLPTVDHTQNVTPGYLSTVGIRVLAGRDFSDGDRDGAQPVAIVSKSMAEHFWPGESALGKRIGYPYASPWLTIVGVVSDVKADSLRDPNAVAAYFPFLQRARAMGAAPELTLVIRTDGDPGKVGGSIRALVADVDKSVPVSNVRTLDDVLAQSVAKPRFLMMLVGGFAAVALILGAVGIYGVMSYVVSQRAQELSVRAALGATQRDILLSVLGRAVTLAGVGAIAGTVLAVLLVRPMRAMFYGVSSNDPLSYAVVAIAFVSIAVFASAGPARRAAGANPASALRGD